MHNCEKIFNNWLFIDLFGRLFRNRSSRAGSFDAAGFFYRVRTDNHCCS